MAKRAKGPTPKKQSANTADVVEVQVSVTKRVARRLSRVSRWERESQGTSLELTGR